MIKDHDNEEDYYPINNDNQDYPDNGSHKYHDLKDIDELDEDEYPQDGPYHLNDKSYEYHTLENIDELDEDQYPQNSNYYPNETYKPNDKTYEPDNDHGYPIPDDDELQFLSIDSDEYWTPNESLDDSYHTANDDPYEDLEDFCCIYCMGQHPDNWCPIPHYSRLDSCLVSEDHPHYIDNVPVDVTCPAEGRHCPYSYWA